jgi:hypothetical protein
LKTVESLRERNEKEDTSSYHLKAKGIDLPNLGGIWKVAFFRANMIVGSQVLLCSHTSPDA